MNYDFATLEIEMAVGSYFNNMPEHAFAKRTKIMGFH